MNDYKRKLIIEAYIKVDQLIAGKFNNTKTRKLVKVTMEQLLGDEIHSVLCDIGNNPPSLADNNQLKATVIYDKNGHQYKYLDLMFPKK